MNVQSIDPIQRYDRRPQRPPVINSDRLLHRIDALARFGKSGGGGITREGFSAADLEARSYLMSEARAAGLVATVDAAGNILMRLHSAPGHVPGRQVLLMGSHLDTVVNAGRLDGAYGVLAAIEALQILGAIAAAGFDLRYEPVAVAFANEEGALFPQPFWGSMAVAGRAAIPAGEQVNGQAQRLREALSLAGGDLDQLDGAAWPSGSVAAYLELHVEQGPVLERSTRRIGIVDGITGRTVLTVRVRGVAAHVGTTPMASRCDALAAAARVVLAVEEIACGRGICRVATVGQIEAHPNSPNTVADEVQLTADLRDLDAERLRAAEEALRDGLRTIAGRTGTVIDVVAEARAEPVATSPALRADITSSADELGLSHALLPSGAGHDAQIIALIAPIGMIFVPSIRGISHVPDEDTSPEDLVAGAQVLLRTALRVVGMLNGS